MKNPICWLLGHDPLLGEGDQTWRNAEGEWKPGYFTFCRRCGELDEPYATNLYDRTVRFWVGRERTRWYFFFRFEVRDKFLKFDRHFRLEVRDRNRAHTWNLKSYVLWQYWKVARWFYSADAMFLSEVSRKRKWRLGEL